MAVAWNKSSNHLKLKTTVELVRFQTIVYMFLNLIMLYIFEEAALAVYEMYYSINHTGIVEL